MAMACSECNRVLVIPKHNAEQASWVKQAKIHAIEHLTQLYAHFARQISLPFVEEQKIIEDFT